MISRTDLTSLTSSIREHVYENGRRYHSLNAGTYALPNDEASSFLPSTYVRVLISLNRPRKIGKHPTSTRRYLYRHLMRWARYRLDMFHHATSLMLDGALHLAKLPQKLDRILDLGTGTGIWAIDIAERVLSAQHALAPTDSPQRASGIPGHWR